LPVELFALRLPSFLVALGVNQPLPLLKLFAETVAETVAETGY